MDHNNDKMPFNNQDVLIALGLDTSKIEDLNIHHDYNQGLIIELTLERLDEPCPICQCQKTKIKGYVTKTVRHSIFNKTPCVIKYRARRYICSSCNKTFYESNSFAYKGTHLSVGSVYNVLTALKSPNATFTSIGEQFNISASSIANIFDQHVQISRRPLPVCLSIDEVAGFKSNGSDYCLVLLDYVDKKLTDLLPSRKKDDLITYFSKIPREEREQVLYISIDLLKEPCFLMLNLSWINSMFFNF